MFDRSMVTSTADPNASELEWDFKISQYSIETTHHKEAQRIQHIRRLLLEHDNDELREGLARRQINIEELAQENQLIRADLAATNFKLDRSHGEARTKAREIEALRAELNSLQGLSSDSTRLLKEKLELVRELTSLKPEIEHLRDQVAAQQATLAEKLSLQRQLGTLQVELDNEKRCTQRIAHRDGVTQDDAKLKTQLERIQNELAQERKDKRKVELESQRSMRDLESKRATLESRMESLKEKLKLAKEEIKNKEVDLRLTKTAADNFKHNGTKSPRKRQFSLVDDDTMIGTPGDGAANKRGRKKPPTLGEKSTFSVTPFLNRRPSVNRESPHSPVTKNKPRNADMSATLLEGDRQTTFHQSEASLNSNSERTTSERKLEYQSNKKALIGRARIPALLEQVVEEEREDLEHLGPETEAGGKARVDRQNQGFPGKTKPRSLVGGLGKTLFDDGDEFSAGDRVVVGGMRRFGPHIQRKGQSSTKTFGSISPLKKDRKGL